MSSVTGLLLTTFLLGSDSFLAGLVIAPIVLCWRARALFVVLFGVCDGAATLLGAALPHSVPDPLAILLYLAAVALIVLGARHSRAWLYAMPFLFGLDNLAAGNPAADAPSLALGSAAMAAAGLAVGAVARRAAIRLAAAFAAS
jgi:hypothetical protein